MKIVSRIMRNLEERLFLSKKITVADVKNMFMKGVTQNHCLGFLAMYYQEIWGKQGWKQDPIYSN